jgi:small subunit ribosomal protein S16
MAVKLRMMRMGRRNRPFFRINAVESRTPRGGRIIEKLGHYDPIEKDIAKQIVLNKERAQYWLDKGAIPSDTVSQILLRQGIKNKCAKERTARRAKAKALARKKGRPFTKAEKEKLAAAKQALLAEKKTEAAPVEGKPKAESAKPEQKPEPQVKAEEKKD